MVSTETSEDFNFDKADEENTNHASQLWQHANSFEWQKSFDAEYGYPPQKYPFLFCHTGNNETTGRNLSGFQRTQSMKEAVNYTENSMHFRVLYNEDNFLCVYGQMFASTASGITGEHLIVQPLVESLKYMKGSVEGMQKEVDFHNTANGESNPSLDVVLCPGVAVADANATEDADEEWEELSDETVDWIVQRLIPTRIASKLAASIADTYFLTSEAYRNATADMGEDTTERSKLWQSLMGDYQESGKCNDTYSNRLTWTMQRARDPEVESSTLHVVVNTTGNSDNDVACILTLSMAIVANPNVCSLENRERVNTHNEVITWLTQSEVKEKRPFFEVGLDGSGQVVAVSDTGCDQDNCYFADPRFKANEFVNRNARKIIQYRAFVDDSDSEYGHGTHVTGTIAGKRIDTKGMADGVAAGAKIAFADIGKSNGDLRPPSDRKLLATGRTECGDTCAKIHSCSWGADVNTYTVQARNFDQYMYDNDDFLLVIAAGNSGNKPSKDSFNTVGSPATGKNIIAVGAHHNTGTSTPKHGLGPPYIADFSSRGPTSDGRTKPDLLAPGKAVLSAGALPNQVGECDPPKRPGANSARDGVFSTQGTSMATPVVSGTAAIIRQYFEEGWYPTGTRNESNIYTNPSGALIKAVLMNGAQFLKGVDNGGGGVTEVQPHDNNQSFGRLALQYSIYLPGKTDIQLTVFDRRAVKDQESDKHLVEIDKSDGCVSDNLSVTLVWMEPGSSPGCTKCVINDVDLSVELGGKTYYPNNLSGPDRSNSAERVIIGGVKDGDNATIIVTGYNLNQKYQKYSLVATGCFGGVANQNFADQCSVFDCDESRLTRMQIILMSVFIPLGVLLLFWGGVVLYRKKEGH